MDALKPIIDRLHAEGRPRVWSLVITVFGDSVQHRGGEIPTARLQKLLGRIGIEPGAIRTALSRLSADGWVEGRREGRSGIYRLTEKGRRNFGPANAAIFAPIRTEPVKAWVFDASPEARGLQIAGGCLSPAPASGGPEGFRMLGTPRQRGAEAIWQALDAKHRMALERLALDLKVLKNGVDDPLDAIAARTLLVHNWRRIVLRWPELPAELTPETVWPGNFRAAVAKAYVNLSGPAELWLDTSFGDTPTMPPAAAGFANRFGGAQSA